MRRRPLLFGAGRAYRSLKNAITVSLIVTLCVFGGGVVGLALHRVVPRSHLTKETQEVIRLGTGMMSIMASLVLGLLIATAKTTYDRTEHDIRTYAAELILLNETLRDYGNDAASSRTLLREYTAQLLEDNWPTHDRPVVVENQAAGTMLEHVREAIRALKPVDDGQRWLQDQALQINVSLLRQRWLLIEQNGPSVQPVVVIVLVSWISMIFASFGLNAPRNGTIVVAFLVCSMAVGGSIFLILEMDDPLTGVLKVHSGPVVSALSHMSP